MCGMLEPSFCYFRGKGNVLIFIRQALNGVL